MNVFPYEGYKKYTKQDIKNLLEDNANTNTLTDAEKSFLQDLIANSSQSVSGVASFNERTGAVTPQSGDYTKSQVGLANVDNTSDLNKPISNATQAALDTKTTQSDINTSINAAISGLTKESVGLGNVDNTNDLNKPISTAIQAALDGKIDTTNNLLVKTLYESNTDTNAYTNDEKTKLQDIPNNLNTTLSIIQNDIDLLESGSGIANITVSESKEHILIGDEAGQAHLDNPSEDKSGNIFIGDAAGKACRRNPLGFWGTKGGLQNIGVGIRSLTNLTDGWFNTATGANSLTNLTTGKACTATGQQSLQNAVDMQDTTATGEASLPFVVTGNSNTATGTSSGNIAGLDVGGREHFIVGRHTNPPRDANNFPSPANYYNEYKNNSIYGAGSGYRISGVNNSIFGAAAMYGQTADMLARGGSTTSIVLSPNSSAVDGFYVPIQPNTYAFAIIDGQGGGFKTGDTYFNDGDAWPDWAANEAVTAGTRRIFNYLEPNNNTNYRYLWVSKTTRTTGSTLDAGEISNWRPICVEHFVQAEYKYYMVAKCTAYNGTTKTATLTGIDGEPLDTAINNTSTYRYTLPPYRLKTISLDYAYYCTNMSSFGYKNLENIDQGTNCASYGAFSLSNALTVDDVTTLGAYSGQTDWLLNPTTSLELGGAIGYDSKTRGNKFLCIGNVQERVLLDRDFVLGADSRDMTNITNLSATDAKNIITNLTPVEQVYRKRQIGNALLPESPYKTFSITAQNVRSALEAAGKETSETNNYSLHVDHNTITNGCDFYSYSPTELVAIIVALLKDHESRIAALEA